MYVENPEWVYDLYYAPKMDGLDAPINDLSELYVHVPAHPNTILRVVN